MDRPYGQSPKSLTPSAREPSAAVMGDAAPVPTSSAALPVASPNASAGTASIPHAGQSRASRAAAHRPPAPPVVRIVDVDIHSVTEREAIDYILKSIDARAGGVVVTPNLDHLRRCHQDKPFAAFVAEAQLVVADGTPVVWASRLQGTPLPERVAGSDLILSLSQAAGEAGRSIFLLGGAPGTAEGAAAVLKTNNPKLKIAGTYCPPFGFESDDAEMARIVAMLSQSRADIVFVALGSPKQEYLVERIRSALPRAWWLGVGVSFSFLTGQVHRAPKWMRKTGLEWTHRLVQEPKKLFKRYIIHGLPFAGVLFASAASHRIKRWLGRDTSASAYRTADRATPNVIEPAIAPDPLDHALTGHEAQNASTHAKATEQAVIDQPQSALLNHAALQDQNGIEIASAIPVSVRGDREIVGLGALEKIRAVVLLGGQLRPSPLMQAVDRSVLDLPLLEDRTLLNHWLTDIAHLREFAKLERLPARLLVSRDADEPFSVVPSLRDMLRIERDASEYRGTGGVIADVARAYDPDDFLLVAHAAQLLLEPLHALAMALDHKRSDVAMIAHADGTPGGLMLIRCAALRQVKPVGFVDMKEQALPQIAKSFDVRVVNCRRPTGLPLRTPEDYISAMRQWHRGVGVRPGSRRGQIDPLAEDFSRGFAVIEPGAFVDSTALLHDAVVLRGSKVESQAAVVRSLVLPGAIVKPNARVIDEVVRKPQTAKSASGETPPSGRSS